MSGRNNKTGSNKKKEDYTPSQDVPERLSDTGASPHIRIVSQHSRLTGTPRSSNYSSPSARSRNFSKSSSSASKPGPSTSKGNESSASTSGPSTSKATTTPSVSKRPDRSAASPTYKSKLRSSIAKHTVPIPPGTGSSTSEGDVPSASTPGPSTADHNKPSAPRRPELPTSSRAGKSNSDRTNDLPDSQSDLPTTSVQAYGPKSSLIRRSGRIADAQRQRQVTNQTKKLERSLSFKAEKVIDFWRDKEDNKVKAIVSRDDKKDRKTIVPLGPLAKQNFQLFLDSLTPANIHVGAYTEEVKQEFSYPKREPQQKETKKKDEYKHEEEEEKDDDKS